MELSNSEIKKCLIFSHPPPPPTPPTPPSFLIFQEKDQETETLKKLLIFRETEPFHPHRIFLIFQETENPKKLLMISQKKAVLIFSGNRNPGKILIF